MGSAVSLSDLPPPASVSVRRSVLIGLIVALTLSVGLNLFGGGLLAGGALSGRAGPASAGPEPGDVGFREAFQLLDSADQAILREAFEEMRRPLMRHARAMREAGAEIHQAMVAEEFDRAAAEAGIDALQAAHDAMRETVRTVLLDAAGQVSIPGRRMLVRHPAFRAGLTGQANQPASHRPPPPENLQRLRDMRQRLNQSGEQQIEESERMREILQQRRERLLREPPLSRPVPDGPQDGSFP